MIEFPLRHLCANFCPRWSYCITHSIHACSKESNETEGVTYCSGGGGYL